MNNRFLIFPFLATALITGICNGCNDSLPPEAQITAFPMVADTTLFFEFNGSKSSDDNTYAEGLQYRWDFESDGKWDSGFDHQPKAVYCYPVSGAKKVTLEVLDSDGKSSKASIQVIVKPANSWIDTLVDPRDNQPYRIVKLNEDWWMAENLNYGLRISSDHEQLNNHIAEKYYLFDDSAGYHSLGGLYRWEEAMNYSVGIVQGVCPPGWHIPSLKEWQSLLIDIDTWYAWMYYSTEGLSGFDIDRGSFAKRRYNAVTWEPETPVHWSCNYKILEFLHEAAPWFYHRGNIWGEIGPGYTSSYYDGSDSLWSLGVNYASVRCIKNR